MPGNLSIALLLEDEPLIAMGIEGELGDAGFAVSTVDSCSDAHSWLDANHPDVVIVDILLKDGSSGSFVERLVNAKIPFVVHSGDQPSQHEGTPFAMGEWMSKPAQMEELSRSLIALACRTR